jgi:hypothetical protein
MTPGVKARMNQMLGPVYSIASTATKKQVWVSWSRLWSRICPSGLQLFVRLAYLPSVASRVIYQKFAKTYNMINHLGISPSIPGLRYAVVASEMIGTISPARVITLGASQSG